MHWGPFLLVVTEQVLGITSKAKTQYSTSWLGIAGPSHIGDPHR